MGICISHRLAQEVKYIKPTIDHAEGVARAIKKEQADKVGISFKIRRPDDLCLMIDIGECETLAFQFKPLSEYKAEAEPKPEGHGWSYTWEILKDFKHFDDDHQGEHYEKWPDQKLVWSSAFCKTQFIGSLVQHKWVADLIRVVASMCVLASVNDEGDYYHNGRIEDAGDAIGECGVLINSIGGQLAGLGYGQDQIIKGGETRVKGRRKV